MTKKLQADQRSENSERCVKKEELYGAIAGLPEAKPKEVYIIVIECHIIVLFPF